MQILIPEKNVKSFIIHKCYYKSPKALSHTYGVEMICPRTSQQRKTRK